MTPTSIGIDVGTRYVKACVVRQEQILGWAVEPTERDLQGAVRKCRRQALAAAGLSSWLRVYPTAATGHGARLAGRFMHRVALEGCAARAASVLSREATVVVDGGGLFIRAAEVSPSGTVQRVHDGDKCAAGSGRFLELVARALGQSVQALSEMAAGSTTPYAVTSGCAVFAESEVISRINDGTDVADIVSGVLHSVASKVGTLLGRVGGDGPVLLLGGLAKIAAMPCLIGQMAGRPVCTPPIDPQLGPAFGAALLARGGPVGGRG